MRITTAASIGIAVLAILGGAPVGRAQPLCGDALHNDGATCIYTSSMPSGNEIDATLSPALDLTITWRGPETSALFRFGVHGLAENGHIPEFTGVWETLAGSPPSTTINLYDLGCTREPFFPFDPPRICIADLIAAGTFQIALRVDNADYFTVFYRVVTVTIDSSTAQIAEAIGSFDQGVAAGTITGIGSNANSAANKSAALRNMLITLQQLIADGQASGDFSAACVQLVSTIKKIDGERDPPDFVGGSSAPQLLSSLTALKASLGCQ